MKITRHFASPQNAVNVQKVIQNLLAVELENLINASPSQETKVLSVKNQNMDRECA